MDQHRTQDGSRAQTEPAEMALELDSEVLDDISIAEGQLARGEGVPHDEALRAVLVRIKG